MSDNSAAPSGPKVTPTGSKIDRIDITWDYAVCAWARHFNTSEQHVRQAVAAVGDRADRVRDHLAQRRTAPQERPSGA